MQPYDQMIATSQTSILSANKVIKNTYMLLSATLIFSALMAMVSLYLAVPIWTYLASIIASMVLGMFVLPRTANSASGIGVIFLITGLMGFGLGAVLTIYMQLPKGPEVIATAFGGTAAIFLGLSGYALTTRRNFSFMGGFLFAGMMVVLLAFLANLFFALPALSLAISAGVILLMSGFILFDTSRIIHGGETNYIMATYGLFLSIFNIFIHLLHLLMAFSGDD
ncbi:MAG: Bax inhibitor-1/YccA family protein [Gammaproteobacteria bacterium]|nr:MAG: Bax inhibitor-1/YccA family protein [Gammaproteobacteria bacterium]